MNRRDVLKNSTLLLGYGLTAGTTMAVLKGCKADPSIDWTPKNLTVSQAVLAAEMAEMIIPKTLTPGAKDALVDRYIDAILDCYTSEEIEDFKMRLDAFDTQSKKLQGGRFYALDGGKRKTMMDWLFEDSKGQKRDHLFHRMREWTVTGYCESEAGATEHLEWNPVPGPFRGCIDFEEVGKTWAI